MRFLILAVVISLGLGGTAIAQQSQGTITVTGVGQVSAAPDMARVTMGVTHRAHTAEEAMALVSQDVAAILEVLKSSDVAARDMLTTGFYLRRIFDRRSSQNGQPPKPIGFESGNMVTVRLREIAKVGRVIADVTKAGVNDVRGINFEIADTAPLMQEARKRAVRDAVARAQDYVEAAGVSLGKVREIREQGGRAPRGFAMAEARMADAAPIEAGEVDLSASVTMIFEIGTTD